jgi:aldose sugar dehydrogenase
MTNLFRLTTLAALAAGAATSALAQSDFVWGAKNVPAFEPLHPLQTRAPITDTSVDLSTEVIAEGLVHPWAIAPLPGEGGFLVTERPGDLRHISPDGTVSEPISGVPVVENRPPAGGATQAGLLDVKLGPDFAEDRMVYMTYAKPIDRDMSVTAAARGRLSEDLTALEEVEDIWVQSPPSPTRMHYGSRIVFDGNGHAFITTGEHSSLAERDFSQQLDKTYGKIIRVNLDGSVPETNPFVGVEGADDAIWSYGHRNVQGAAMKGGFLWTIEHGPAGGDELNIALPSRNYGWPVVSYGQRYVGVAVGTGLPRMPGMEEPLYYWDPVIAPGDMAFYDADLIADWQDDLLIGGLVADGLVRLEVEGPVVTGEERILTGFGRVRDVEVLDDGSLVFVTDYENGQLVHASLAEGS